MVDASNIDLHASFDGSYSHGSTAKKVTVSAIAKVCFKLLMFFIIPELYSMFAS